MYVKYIDETTIEQAPVNLGTIINFNLNEDLMREYGYKPLVPLGELPETNRMLHIGYEETENTVNEVVVYDETQRQADKREFNTRKEQFNREFFRTSLGYVRRKVHMNTGEIKDFLSDLLPTISLGVNIGQQVTILTYDAPDFTQDVEDWTELQHSEAVTAQFIQECLLQLSNDFLPAATTESEPEDEENEEPVENTEE